MKRIALAILGVIVAVAVLVVIARQNPEKPAPPAPRPTVSTSMAAETASANAGPDPNDVQLEVKESVLSDGGDRTSIRVEHPDPAMQGKLREFLEPREQAAAAKNTALDCHAQIAKTSLVSITCVTMVPVEGAAGAADAGATLPIGFTPMPDAGPRTEPKYESLTLRFVRGQVKQLALADVLTADAGQGEVVEACKKAAEPDLACDWPPTDFALSPGGTLFLCHGSHCVDIDADDAPTLLRPEYR